MIRGDLVLTSHTVVVACCRVFLLPAVEADLLSAGTAGVVAEVVVPWLAVQVAVAAIVLVGADKPEVVLQLGVVAVDPVVSALKTV